MKITSAEFLMSNTNWRKCPQPVKPEYAFVGRSNVGKSSLINMLVNRKGMAKTSGKPGKTQLINHFEINKTWFLVDLPGYGYAKVSKMERVGWDKLVKNYLGNRENLQCVFVLIDSRLTPQPVDIEFINFLGEHGIPFVLAFTKADKQSVGKTQENIKVFTDKLLEEWDELPQVFTTSADKHEGRDEILAFIDEVNKTFVMPPKSANKPLEEDEDDF